MEWPFGKLALENRLKNLKTALVSSGGARRWVLTPAEQAVQGFGAELFDLLFNGEVRNCYDVSRERANHQGKGIRIKLRIQSPVMANLPWEYLYDSRMRQYLCLSQQTPLVHYLELPHAVRHLSVTPPLRILAMIAAPSDLQELDVTVERQRLEQAIAPLQAANLVELHWLENATRRALQRALRRDHWHLFHFIGHGDFDQQREEGLVAFCNDQGRAQLMSAGDLGHLLADHDTLRLAVLNACASAQGSHNDRFASTAATLVRSGIPAVIAMQHSISDRAAIEFSQTFYESLADGLPVDGAVTEARKAILLSVAHSLEWGTPVLYSRASDGRLFTVEAKDTRQGDGKGDSRDGVVSAKASNLPTASADARSAPFQGNIAQDSIKVIASDIIEFEAISQNSDQLASYTSIEEIGEAYIHLRAGRLEESELALLRTFGRISQNVYAALEQESNYNQRLSLSVVEEDLDRLIRELNSSRLKYAEIFFPVAIKWRGIIHAYQEILAIEIKLGREIENPYIIGVPLTNQQKIFVGRTDIGNRIGNLLLEQQRPPLLLYGQRRMGKTSLLNNLGRLLPSTIVPLVVDLQGPVSSAKDITGFLYNIAKSIATSGHTIREIVIQSLTRDALIIDPFTIFNEWLDEVERSLGEDTALLVLDEFEALDIAIQRGRYDAEDVFSMLRHIIQHRTKFKVLFAGSHTLAEYHRWASYLINVQTIHISYLQEDEARQLIERPVSDFTLRYAADASQRVIDLTRGHPFLVQLLCSELIALKNEQELSMRRLATLADVEAAVPEALAHGSMFFADIEHNQVNEAGRTILRNLAVHGEGGVSSRGQLAQVCPDALDETIRLLQQRELIESVEDGYSFQVELIRRWFAQPA